jgi:beta-lactamase regulating signal transducer with metallopeptidase domain
MIGTETINLWARSWAEFMGYRALESSVVFVVVSVLWLLLRKRVPAQFGYLLFLLVLAKLVVPSQISVPSLVAYLFPSSSVEDGGVGVEGAPWWMFWGDLQSATGPNVSLSDKTGATGLSGREASGLGVFGWLFVVYGLIVVALLFRLGWVEWRARRMYTDAVAIDSGEMCLDLEDLQRIAGVKQRVRWVAAPWLKSPVVCGVFQPRIVLPPDLCADRPASQIRWILLHELAHIQRRDSVVVLIQQILQILFFFHPVVWWANSKINELREFACDDWALVGSKVSRRDSAEGFFSSVMQANDLPTLLPATLGMIGYKTSIKRRLNRIMDGKRKISIRLATRDWMEMLLVAVLIMPLGARIATAQGLEWKRLATEGPEPRHGHAMVYDPGRGKTVMFGGMKWIGRIMLNDTWEWDGTKWTEVSVDRGDRPAARLFMPMVYDSVRGKMVLFGGADVVAWKGYGDTWEFDGTRWSQVATTGPSVRYGHVMAFDAARGKIVLFGGSDQQLKDLGDLWEWDGNKWSQLDVATLPPPRCLSMMAYDARREKTVLFGGVAEPSTFYGDTWEWDGSTFNKVADSGPEPREWAGITYDTARGRVVLFGGADGGAPGYPTRDFGDTWEWDGREWTQVQVLGPEPRSSIVLSYDIARGRITLFGGAGRSGQFADTWELGLAGSGIPSSLWALH